MAKDRTTRKKLRNDSCFVTRRRFNDAANPPKSDTPLRAGKEESALPQSLQSFPDLRDLLFLGSRGGSFHLPSPKSSSHCRTSSSRVVPFASAICFARSSRSASALNVIFRIAIVLPRS